ncbi:MAG: TonB-dependent receptor [Bacteroidales bacterium]
MKNLLIYLLFLHLVSLPLEGQKEVAGTIADHSGQRLENVKVCATGIELCTFSNIYGEFRLEIPDSIYSISIEKEGYLSQQQPAAGKLIDIELQSAEIEGLMKMSLGELLEVKITSASKHEELITEIPASVVVFTRKEIERFGFTSFSEILQHVPGLYMIDDHYWLGSVNYGVRGFFSTGPFNNMVILVNGISQLSDKYSEYPDNKINVPVESIEKVEVIRGPMSVLYGTGAFFGVINIVTNTNPDQSEGNRVSASYGSYETKKANISLSGKQEKLSFAINAGISDSKGMEVPFSSLTSDMEVLKYVGLDTNATTKNQGDDNRKYFNLNLGYNGFFTDISITESTKDIFDGQPGYGKGCELFTQAQNVVAGYQKQFNPRLYGRVRAGYYSHSHTLDYEVFRKNYYEIDQQHTRSVDIDLYAFWKPVNKIEFIGGLYRRTVLDIYQVSDYSYYGLNNGGGEIGLPDGETFSTTAAYAQFKVNPFENLSIIGGGRLEHLDDYSMEYVRGLVSENPDDGRSPDSSQFRKYYSGTYYPGNNGFTFTPRLAVLYRLNRNNTLKLLFGNAIKQPSYTENYRQLPKGKPFLDAARITTLELNYLTIISNKLNVNFSLFQNQLNDLITNTNIRDTASGEWLIYNSNGGRMQTLGAELSLQILLFERLSIGLSGTYQHSENLDDSLRQYTPGYSPEKLGYLTVGYMANKHLCLSATGHYISRMESEMIWSVANLRWVRIGNSIDPYFIADINLRYSQIANTGFFASVKLGNIFDTPVRYAATRSNVWMDKGSRGPGHTIQLSAGFEFK